jgi:hypothetical protein
VVGYDLYRSVLGSCSGASSRLTDQPWSRVLNQSFIREYVDADVQPGVKYEYRVVGVDADRNMYELWSFCPVFDTPPYVFASCGLAPIAHGTVSSAAEWVFFNSCDPCFNVRGIAFGGPPGLEAYYGTGTQLLLYGNVVPTLLEGNVFYIQAFEVLPCTNAVSSTTWGGVKTLFR